MLLVILFFSEWNIWLKYYFFEISNALKNWSENWWEINQYTNWDASNNNGCFALKIESQATKHVEMIP